MELKHLSSPVTYSHLLLLIVPYGIETVGAVGDIEKYSPFNRTLWN